MAICDVGECGRLATRRQWCSAHYQRWRRYGDPLKGSRIRGMSGETLARWMLTDQARSSGECLEWRGNANRGYGRLRFEGKDWYAHRLIYHFLVEYLPKTDPVHHICGNSLCINPVHLQRVSHRENTAEMLERRYYVQTIEDHGDRHDYLVTRLAALEEALAAYDPEHPLLSE